MVLMIRLRTIQQHDVAGRGDHAAGEAIQQFTLDMPLWEVLSRIDPVGYARMLQTMPQTDVGFGIRLGNYYRNDWPRLIVSPSYRMGR